MTRSIFRPIIGVAIFLTVCVIGIASNGQDSWNHGFGSRNYGYSGNAYSQSVPSQSFSNPGFSNPGFGFSNSYVTGFVPYYGGYYPYYGGPYYGGYAPYYGAYYPYNGVALGVYSTGTYATGNYAYSVSPTLYAPYRNLGVRPNLGAVPPKPQKNKPRGVQQQQGAQDPLPGAARAW